MMHETLFFFFYLQMHELIYEILYGWMYESLETLDENEF